MCHFYLLCHLCHYYRASFTCAILHVPFLHVPFLPVQFLPVPFLPVPFLLDIRSNSFLFSIQDK